MKSDRDFEIQIRRVNELVLDLTLATERELSSRFKYSLRSRLAGRIYPIVARSKAAQVLVRILKKLLGLK